MKNYFITNGEVLSTNINIEEMKSQVQGSLDKNTSGVVQFRVKEINEKEVRMFFVRDFSYGPDKSITFGAGVALITGVGIGAFQPQ